MEPSLIEDRILKAVGDTEGAIVIRVQANLIFPDHEEFSDECLKANLAAARRLNADAREKNIERSITFILPPAYAGVLERMQALDNSHTGQ